MADTATRQTPNIPKQERTPSNTGRPVKSIKKKKDQIKPQEAKDIEVDDSKLNPKEDIATQTSDAKSQVHETNDEYEKATTGDVEDETIDEEEEEDEGTEIIPAGSVTHDGKVVDKHGKTIGHVKGDADSQLEGSVVDQDGDILDEEGNVIGTAELVEHAATDISKPELEAPFGVQDNGEITNATGAVVGKLSEGKPQDLVGTAISQIDAQGNLVGDTGSTIGKAEIQPELLKAADDVSQGLGATDPTEKLKEADSKLPEKGALDEAGEDALSEKADSAIGLQETEVQKPDVDQPDIGQPGIDQSDIDQSAIGKPDVDELDVKEPGVEEPDIEKVDAEKTDLPAEAGLDAAGEHGLDEVKAEDAPVPELSEEPEDLLKEGQKDEAVSQIADQPEGLQEMAPKPVDDEQLDTEAVELPDLSILKDKKVNKLGKIVDENGNPFGQLIEGDVKKLIGKKVDAEGQIWNDSGKIIGRAELLPEDEREVEPSAPFEDFPDSVLDDHGNVIFEGKIVGKLIEGDAKKLDGKKVDADGDVLDKNGNVLGKAERFQEEDIVPEVEEPTDLSILEGKKVNKLGNVVDDNGKLFGRVISGVVSKMVGKKVDGEGKIWSESGKVMGTAELIPVDDRDEESGAPFEDFPDAVVEKTGNIVFEGKIVGKLIEGDPKKLAGKKIDQDGEVIDKLGNVLGKAERWEEEDIPEPEKIDMSALAGKRVNKNGNLVDSHGSIYGRLVEGDAKKLVGKMSDKNGNIWDEGGNIVGRAELVPESERDGLKEGPFTGFDSPTVTKDGKVADAKGVIIGRLIEGDAKKLYGKKVDPDGDVVDSNGNSVGKAERWEEEEKKKVHSPVAGRKVNREGNVVDENGDIIAKLTEGEVTKCAGKEIDEDGDVYNSKNQVIGHVTLLGEIPAVPEPEPEPVIEEEVPTESLEEIEAKKQLDKDKKLASRMAFAIQDAIDKITPLLNHINDEIDAVEKKPERERDEQKLVDTVRPLIEEGSRILTETNGIIRGMDPDGRITANAKGRGAERDPTPEEVRLADLLKELTGNVAQAIERAKKKIAGMPHAKKELNPLWGLLAEPLGQILAAVGLLLSGVLGLVGRLLGTLGLGGLLDNLLGGLGIKGILNGLGLGMVTSSLTGRK